MQSTALFRTRSLLLAALAIAAGLAACSGPSEESLIESAQTYRGKGDDTAATIELKRALQANPASAEARRLLGLVLLDGGDPAAAEIELSRAEELGASADSVAPALAQAQLLLGQPSKVVLQFADLQLQDPTAQAALRAWVASAYGQIGDAPKAEQQVDQALSAVPLYPPAVMVRARLKAAAGDVDEALRLLDSVLTVDPGNAHAGNAKGYLLWFGKNDAQAALQAHRQVLQAHPANVPALAETATILFRSGQTDDARAQFEVLKKTAPRHPETLLFEAQFAYVDGQYRRSRELTDALLALTPDHLRALELSAAAEYQLGNDTLVEGFASRALKANPRLILARQILAQSQLRAGQPGKAVAVLEPLLEGENADAESLAIAGVALMQMGDTKRADAAFRAAKALAPDNAKVRTRLALSLLAGGQSGVALKELQDIAASDTSPRSDLALLSALISSQDWPGARRAVDKLADKMPDHPLPHQLRGQIQVSMRDAAGARKSFESALSVRPGYFPAVAALASMDMAQRLPADAKARVESFVQRVPNNASAHVLLADIAEASGDSPVAVVAHLADAVRADPRDAGAHLALINRNLRLDNRSAALAAAQAAVAALPDNTSLGMALGRAQLAAGDARQATTTLNKLAATSPPGGGLEVQMALSEAAIALNDFAGARRALERALEIDPDLASARRGLAVLAVRDGRIDEALALAAEMQRRQPKGAMGFMVEGDIQLQRRNGAAAAKAFRKALDLSGASEVAIKLHHALSTAARPDEAAAFAASWEAQRPNDPAFHFYLGDTFTQRGDHASAEKHYRRVLITQPDSALALNNIAWAMHVQSKPGALGMAQKANALMPDQAPILDTLGTIQAAAGQWPEAVKTQQQAVNRAPDDAGLRLKLARYLVQTGSKDEAKLHLEVLARLGDRFPQQTEVAGLLKGL